MNHFNCVIKVTNNCNLNCEYCYYRSSIQSGNDSKMSDSVLDSTICKIIDYNDSQTVFIWHGGEPLLAGINFFKKACNYQQRYLSLKDKNIVITNSIQTNGLCLNSEWIEFFKEYNFKLGISLDGPFSLNSKGRRISNKQFSIITNNIEKINKAGLPFGICCVINDYTIGHEQEMFDFFVDNNIKYVAFLPMNYGNPNDCLSANDFGNFLVKMFYCWLKYDGDDIYLREINDVTRGLLGKTQLLCRNCNNCNKYYTIMPNGDVYQCDNLIKVNNSKLGNIEKDNFTDLQRLNDKFISKVQILPEECIKCKYKNICNGGCLFHRWVSNHAFTGVDYYCESYKKLYKVMSDALVK